MQTNHKAQERALPRSEHCNLSPIRSCNNKCSWRLYAFVDMIRVFLHDLLRLSTSPDEMKR